MFTEALQERVDLSRLNTLRIRSIARYFMAAHNLAELRQVLAWARQQNLAVLILGGGSNIVLSGDFDGVVIHLAITGRHWENVSDDSATLVLGAGENWHDTVIYAATSGYRGIENLALIPGSVGAAPVQNIGAYGVELKDSLSYVTVLDRHADEVVTLSTDACRFAYRDSLFKHQPGRFIILEVALTLSRSRMLALGYGELARYFSDHKDSSILTPLHIAEGVMAIRRRKLPDPDKLPNAGSFFKNPVVSLERWDQLKASYPSIAAYPLERSVKLAAAWLIDQCGWKGYRNATVGVHSQQALVLVNHSGGTGQDVLALAERIRSDVEQTFGVALDVEPRVIASGEGAEVT